jgi:mono/diheme cytochrome c family protein
MNRVGAILVLGLIGVAGCTDVNNMREQPSYRPLEMSALYADSGASRPPVGGTVPRSLPGDRWALTAAESALVAGRAPERRDDAPRPVTAELLARGRERFEIFCTPCHGSGGYGDGMVARRGFPQPASYHTDRARGLTDAQIFAVVTGGRGKMPAYGPYIAADDRWAIIAYVRALQLSQHAPASDLADEDRAALMGEGGP